MRSPMRSPMEICEDAAKLVEQHPVSLPNEDYQPALQAFRTQYAGVLEPSLRASLLMAFLCGWANALDARS